MHQSGFKQCTHWLLYGKTKLHSRTFGSIVLGLLVLVSLFYYNSSASAIVATENHIDGDSAVLSKQADASHRTFLDAVFSRRGNAPSSMSLRYAPSSKALLLSLMPPSSCRSDAWPPHMTAAELSMLVDLTQEEDFASRTVFEIGTGGSTNLFAGQARFTWAVEHAPKFCGTMVGLKETSCNVRNGKLMYACTPVALQSELLSWSRFSDEKAIARSEYSQYVQVMNKLLGHPKSDVGYKSVLPQPSVFFIDGRFRVACALTALARILQMPEKVHKPYILIHDYTDRSRNYWKLVEELKFLSIERQAGSLVKLVPVSDVMLADVEAALVDALKEQV